MLPVVELSKPALLATNVVVWGLVHAGTGYLVHRLPARTLQRDGWLFGRRSFERDGELYRRTMRIARWKDRLPEAGALFAGGVSKRHLPSATDGGLERFAVETRRAELGHWLAACGGPLFALWNPGPLAAVMVLYGVGINAPFIAIQRYNRARVARVLRSRASRSTRGVGVRRCEGTRGRSMP